MGDFVGAIGQGVSGLVGGSINALSAAFDSVVGTLQQMLPGPLFPAFIVAFIVVLALLFKRLF
jgi:hypothetical protein